MESSMSKPPYVKHQVLQVLITCGHCGEHWGKRPGDYYCSDRENPKCPHCGAYGDLKWSPEDDD
jgi:hypothetical protein